MKPKSLRIFQKDHKIMAKTCFFEMGGNDLAVDRLVSQKRDGVEQQGNLVGLNSC